MGKVRPPIWVTREDRSGGKPHRHCIGWTPGHWTKGTLVPG